MKQELYTIASELNNHPTHINVDKVTIMAFMSVQECLEHITKMRKAIEAYEAGR